MTATAFVEIGTAQNSNFEIIVPKIAYIRSPKDEHGNDLYSRQNRQIRLMVSEDGIVSFYQKINNNAKFNTSCVTIVGHGNPTYSISEHQEILQIEGQTKYLITIGNGSGKIYDIWISITKIIEDSKVTRYGDLKQVLLNYFNKAKVDQPKYRKFRSTKQERKKLIEKNKNAIKTLESIHLCKYFFSPGNHSLIGDFDYNGSQYFWKFTMDLPLHFLFDYLPETDTCTIL